MTADELYKKSKLQEAIEAQIQEVKAKPADHTRRLFLFELFAYAGELDRARKQAEAINFGEMERDTLVMGYRKLLDAEQARRNLFTKGEPPKFLVKPPEHVDLRLQALALIREGKHAEANDILINKVRPLVEAHPIKGMFNNKPFVDLCDGDELLGTVLEVMYMDRYFWIPMEQIDTLACGKMKAPRDLLYRPARLEVKGGPSGEVFIPTLYYSSYQHAEEKMKLGRDFEFKAAAEGGPILGVGRKQFLIGESTTSLLEWETLEVFDQEGVPTPAPLEPAEPAAETPPPDNPPAEAPAAVAEDAPAQVPQA